MDLDGLSGSVFTIYQGEEVRNVISLPLQPTRQYRFRSERISNFVVFSDYYFCWENVDAQGTRRFLINADVAWNWYWYDRNDFFQKQTYHSLWRKNWLLCHRCWSRACFHQDFRRIRHCCRKLLPITSELRLPSIEKIIMFLIHSELSVYQEGISDLWR